MRTISNSDYLINQLLSSTMLEQGGLREQGILYSLSSTIVLSVGGNFQLPWYQQKIDKTFSRTVFSLILSNWTHFLTPFSVPLSAHWLFLNFLWPVFLNSQSEICLSILTLSLCILVFCLFAFLCSCFDFLDLYFLTFSSSPVFLLGN